MSPPVQLVDYVVERFDFEVNPAFRLNREAAEAALEKTEVSLNLELDWSEPSHPPDAISEKIGVDSDGVEVFILELTLNINDRDNFAEKSQYRICLKIDGFLQRVPMSQIEDVDEAEYLKHSIASGVSILYGAARNVISSMTAQSPYDKLILPSISPNRITSQIMELRAEKKKTSDQSSAPASQ